MVDAHVHWSTTASPTRNVQSEPTETIPCASPESPYYSSHTWAWRPQRKQAKLTLRGWNNKTVGRMPALYEANLGLINPRLYI